MKNLLIIRECIWWPHVTFAEVGCCYSQRVQTNVTQSLSAFRREMVFCVAGEYSAHTHTHTHTHIHSHTHTHTLFLSLSLEVADNQRDSTRVPICDLFCIRLYRVLRIHGTLAQNVTRRDFLGTRRSLLTHCLFRLPEQCLCIVKIIWLRTDSVRSIVATK